MQISKMLLHIGLHRIYILRIYISMYISIYIHRIYIRIYILAIPTTCDMHALSHATQLQKDDITQVGII